MIAGNDERIALVIETQTKLEGLRAAKAEMQRFGQAVKQMGAESAASSTLTAARVKEIGAAFNSDITTLRLYGQQVNLTNKEAVAAFRSSIVAQRELGEATGATTVQLERLDAMLARIDRDAATAQAAAVKAGQVASAQATFGTRAAALAARRDMDAISPKARSAASGLAILTQAAVTGQGSLSGIANAAGLASYQIAAMASTAKVAAAASGIGAIITVGAVLTGVLLDVNKAAAASQMQLDELGKLGVGQIDAYVSQLEDRKARAQRLFDFLKPRQGMLTQYVPDTRLKKAKEDLQQYTDLLTHAKDTQQALHGSEDEHERKVALALTRQFDQEHAALILQAQIAKTRAMEPDSLQRTAVIQRAQFAAEATASQAEIERRYTLVNINGKSIQLSTIEAAQKRELLALAKDAIAAKLQQLDAEQQLTRAQATRAAQIRIGQGSDTVIDRYHAQLAAIQDAKAAAIASGTDQVTAEAEAQQKIRKLKKDTLHQSQADLKTLSDATINSHNKIIRGVGKFADTVRRLQIGAEAADAAVKSAKQFALVPASLAVADFVGAALHAASGVQLAAAAALGFREARTGGSSSSGSGGGGGASGGTGAFTPTASSASQPLTITLITRDPYGRDAIQNTLYEVNRSQKLKRPIPIHVTSGLVQVGGR